MPVLLLEVVLVCPLLEHLLWQVEDQASSELVSSFYQYLKVGLPKATALQKAQLDWLKENPQGKLSHAGYWASFMLIGNWQ